VADQANAVEVIHAGAAEITIGYRKARRLDDVRLHVQAGAEPENRSGVLRNVRLEQGYAHALKMAFFKRPPGEKVTVAE
jgi:hypothetical protein